MQYKIVALSAIAATASAQTAVSSVVASYSSFSIDTSQAVAFLSALPSSEFSEFLASPSAWAADLYSDLSAGETPSWVTNLPPAVTSGILPYNSNGTIANGTVIPSNSTSSSRTQTSPRITGGGGGRPTTQGSDASSSAAATPSEAASASSSVSDGGASMPTAIVGAGLAGAVGLVGLLAL